MPLYIKEIEDYQLPVSFPKRNQVKVMVGPCSASYLKSKKIPLNGLHYQCAGEIICKNGQKLRASFMINTHHFDFLDRESVRIHLDDGYYTFDEKELYEKLNLTKEEIFPYLWQTDIPLDYHKTGPYPMIFE
jgi:hypothetical protein